MERYHIIKRRKGWALQREGALKAARVYESKDTAKKEAQKYRKQGLDLIVHRADGTVEEWQKAK